MIVSLEPELLERLTRLDDPRNIAEAEELDDNLAAAVRRAGVMRRIFYAAVLLVALYGTATGAIAAFNLPWWIAVGGICALELGGVTFLSNADVRRRLGEHATPSRLLGGIIAAAAASFNVVTHGNRLLGGFFALMSTLGFVSWWLDTENKRRDRLRSRGLLPAPTPKYELWGHWVRHPMITAQARSLAKTYPQLGLYGSLEAALIIRRRERRNAALGDALRSRIRAARGKKMANIAILTFDMDEVARRLRANADYDGLTALLSSELTAERVLHDRDDEAAVAARAWLAQHGQSALPIAAPPPSASTHEPAPTADQDTVPSVNSPSSDVDRGANATDSTAGEYPRPLGSTVDARRPPEAPAVNGSTRPAHPAAPATALPARHATGRGITVTLAEPPEDGHHRQPEIPAPPGPPSRTTTEPAEAPDPPSGGPVRVTVIGEPAILDADGQPVRGLRAKSMELLVFLVVHRNGATLTGILDAVWPDVAMQRANQRLSTCLSNLRNIIRSVREAKEHDDTSAEGARPEPIVNTGGHYHLDPTIVRVDWWQLFDEQRAGSASITDEIVNAARARIADGYDFPWLDTDRDVPPSPEPGSPPRGSR
jgi:hypothetical protein